MSVESSDIKFYKATNNNDTAANGGSIGTTQVVTNTSNNLFPNVTNAERVAGVTRYRKEFMRNENASNLTLSNAYVWIGVRSSAADYFQIYAGTDTDTQAEADDYTNWCGTGTLNTAVGSSESTLIVDYDTSSGVFSGESLYVHVDDGNNEADVMVVGTPSWLGTTATFTISGDLGANFSADETVVSTMLSLDSIATSYSNWTENSAAGTYDETSYAPTLYNVGTVSDSITLTFSDANNFSGTAATAGSLGSGDISTDFQPANGASYYFKIDADGWGGSWAAGDTITFDTVHAGKSIWWKQVVPAGIASYSNSVVTLDGKGESA